MASKNTIAAKEARGEVITQRASVFDKQVEKERKARSKSKTAQNANYKPPVGEITPPKMSEEEKDLMQRQQPALVLTPKARSKSRHKRQLSPDMTEEESEADTEKANQDPYMKAANKEFELAKKMFEEAQKSKQDAAEKQELRVKT